MRRFLRRESGRQKPSLRRKRACDDSDRKRHHASRRSPRLGVGDVIVPKAEQRKINTQLPDFEAPVIKTYSLESTIAEKFDAILQRFELTGRMKDFYDIYYLSRTFDFEGAKLQSAVFETLQRRGTPYDRNSFKRVVALAEDEDMQKRWKYFLKTIKDDTLAFSVVIQSIQTFLEPVFDAIVNEDEWQKMWYSTDNKWRVIKENE